MVKVQTVRGSIEPDEMGITLPHEHLIFDFTGWLRAPGAEARLKLPQIEGYIARLTHKSCHFKKLHYNLLMSNINS